MKAEVIKDAMLLIKAGQIVDISEEQFAVAKRLGLVKACEEKKSRKK